MEITQKYFKKYHYLAKVYSNKVFNEHIISLEKKDIEQELSIRIFTTIEAYGRSYSAWLNGRKIEGELNKRYDSDNKIIFRPIPLKYYIKLALVNKVRDYIKIINRESKISIEEISYDYGSSDSLGKVDFINKELIVNDVDLLEGLTKEEAKIYALFLKGYTTTKISKIYKGDVLVEECINKQNLKMESRKDELFASQQVYEVFSVQEEK